jgi:molybdopterin converting factor small subunit
MVGKSEEKVTLPGGATAMEAIRAATIGEKTAYENIFNSDGTLKQYLVVMRNGLNITMRVLVEPLKDGDLLQLLPTACGGWLKGVAEHNVIRKAHGLLGQ